MRVYVEEDMTVCHRWQTVTLPAGTVVEGPLAVYLVESECAVTIEDDDRPAATPAASPEQTAAGPEPATLPLTAQVSQSSTTEAGSDPTPETGESN